mgnify:CR=1 FL=1
MENLEYLEKKAYSLKKNKNLDSFPLFFNSEELDLLSKRSIAIVGTNGKTSTATLIFAYIKYFKKDVVKFISPHLVQVNERIETNTGIIKDKEKLAKGSMGRYYEQQSLGFNYRLSDFQAALGISQLERLPSFITQRSKNAQRYIDAIGKDSEILLQLGAEDASPNWYRFVLKLGSRLQDCKMVFDQNRISCIQPVHNNELLHKLLGLPQAHFPCSEEISASVLSIPVSVSYTHLTLPTKA